MLPILFAIDMRKDQHSKVSTSVTQLGLNGKGLAGTVELKHGDEKHVMSDNHYNMHV